MWIGRSGFHPLQKKQAIISDGRIVCVRAGGGVLHYPFIQSPLIVWPTGAVKNAATQGQAVTRKRQDRARPHTGQQTHWDTQQCPSHS